MNRWPYKKMAGRGLTWGGPSRVWLGEDHVLLVLTHGFTESYRRFFFHDIQGFIVRKTHIGKIWNAVWGTVAAFFLLLALALNGIAAVVMLGFATPFLAALLINTVLGPTCAFHVQTAVQTERAPAISRVRTAEKFIARVEPFATNAQGEVPSGQLETAMEQLQNLASRTAAAPPLLGS